MLSHQIAPRPSIPTVEFDFSELFTGAARQVIPLLCRKGLAFSYDCRGETANVVGDMVSLRCGLHRMLCGALDLIDAGFVVIEAETRVLRSKLVVSVRVAGSGLLADVPTLDLVLARLQLKREVLAPGVRLCRANGACPRTGAAIEFSRLPGEGFLFHLQLQLALAGPPDSRPRPDARQARAWVIDGDDPSNETLTKRLQRLGWATTRFDSPAQALRHLHAMPPHQLRPAVVIACDCAATDAAVVARLRGMLPDGTRIVHAMVPGGVDVRELDGTSNLDVQTLPFSPLDLQRLTEEAAHLFEAPSGRTRPAPLRAQDRPGMLIVDDDEVNRTIAAAMAETLGFRVRTACDGMNAVTACLEEAPDVLLLDLHMPGMGGLEASRRLRDLQRIGALPPFAIIAATTDTRDDTPGRCAEAGMDACLLKPIMRPALKAEVRRVQAIADHADLH